MNTGSGTPRIIIVSWAKKCKTCGVKIEEGEQALWNPLTHELEHPACSAQSADQPSAQPSGDATPPESSNGGEDPTGGEGDGESEDNGSDDSESDSESESDSGSDSDSDSDGSDDSDSDSDSDSEPQENPYKNDPNSRRYKIVEDYLSGMNRAEIHAHWAPNVYMQHEPWVFSRRVNGSKIPHPIDRQLTELKYEINRTIAALEKDPKESKSESKPESKPESESKPEPTPKDDAETKVLSFVEEMQRIRASLDAQAGAGNQGRVDHVSYRPIEYGIRMILNGISVESALFAFSLHWPEETRRLHGIKTVDPLKSVSKIDVPAGEPKLLGYVRKLARAKVPVMLVGPAGAGKSRMAETLARVDFDGRFASCPLTAGIMPSWLIGTHTVNGWSSRPFLDIYANGGVFAFEEMDSADPNVLLIINNAIANGYLDNPNDGERYVMHESFQPVACCNTLGLGADRFYVGRERLDFATIDRFRMGRVMVGMDNDVDIAIATAELERFNSR